MGFDTDNAEDVGLVKGTVKGDTYCKKCMQRLLILLLISFLGFYVYMIVFGFMNYDNTCLTENSNSGIYGDINFKTVCLSYGFIGVICITGILFEVILNSFKSLCCNAKCDTSLRFVIYCIIYPLSILTLSFVSLGLYNMIKDQCPSYITVTLVICASVHIIIFLILIFGGLILMCARRMKK